MKKLFLTLMLILSFCAFSTEAHAVVVGQGCTTVHCCYDAIAQFCKNPANLNRLASCTFNDGDEQHPHWLNVSRVCGDPSPLLPPAPVEGPNTDHNRR